MVRSIVFTAEAKAQLAALHIDVQRAIKQHLKKIALQDSPGKELVDELAGLRSERAGKYRVVFELSSEQMLVLVVGHRRDVYTKALELLQPSGE